MILVPNCSGQMCNRLIYLVHALATAIDCGRDLVYLYGDVAHDFSDLHPEVLGGLKVRCFNWRRSIIVDGLCGFLEGHCHPDREGYTASSPRHLSDYRSRSRMLPIVLWDWGLRNFEGVNRYRAQICAYLRAKDAFVVRARDIVAKAREGVDAVVGVHIRRGDYKEAFGGRYYFSDDEYLRFMRDVERSFGRPMRFIVVSNEPVDCAFFASHGVSVVDASASAPEDVVTLSECDYIMGPRSTFSKFAAYYGDKPICRILNRAQDVSMKEFVLVENL